jgi:hypothetical protein
LRGSAGWQEIKSSTFRLDFKQQVLKPMRVWQQATKAWTVTTTASRVRSSAGDKDFPKQVKCKHFVETARA